MQELKRRPAELVPAPPLPGEVSRALSNLRGVVILVVLAFHAFLAYLGSLQPSTAAFAAPPYAWRAFPIIDTERWFGFDLFCAWQDVYLMSMMFFLSALFTWSSLVRKGMPRFLADRLLRLGLPFAFGLAVVMPLALYPVYRLGAADPSLLAYARALGALPFWPDGPMWFLWQLLALTILAAGICRFAPGLVTAIGRRSAAASPGRFFAWLVFAAAVAYVPLALAFTPWAWSEHGILSFQFSRPLLYAVFYGVGLGLGAAGLGRGLLAPEGALARHWARWLAFALAALALWMGLTGLAMADKPVAPLWLQTAVDASFALACAGGCLFMLAAALRFGRGRSRLLDSLSENAFAIYLLHYVAIVWLQYALLGAALPGVAKGLAVFAGTLLLSWPAAILLSAIPVVSRLVGTERRPLGKPAPVARPLNAPVIS